MDLTGWGLVAFVVLLSGALSYYGDVLGRKLGKKRLTIGRLRPRHTAAMMTALFGMIGSLIAILALISFSTPVRVMLFEGDKLRADMVQLRKQLSASQADLEKRQKDLENTKGEVKTEKGRVADEKAKLASAQSQVSQLKSMATTLRKQAGVIRKEVQSVRKQLAAIKPEFDRVKKEKATAEKAVAYSNGELQKIDRKNLELMNEIRDKEKKISGLQTQFDNLNKDFSDLQTKYANQALDARHNIEDLRTQVDDAQKELVTAKNDLAVAKSQADLIGSTVAISRIQPLTFSRDDEMARISVRSNLNLAEARATVFALMDQAATLAKGEGASPALGGKSYVALPLIPDKNKQIIPEDVQIQNLVQQLVNVNHEQVLIANAYLNAFKGEPVPLRIRVFANPVVYRKEQIIVETKIDGTLTQDQIVDAITKFVQEQLAPRAIKDGMIPAIGQAHPLGEVSQQDLLNLVSEIKSHQFTSRVKVVAAQETRAGDKLKLEFRVS